MAFATTASFPETSVEQKLLLFPTEELHCHSFSCICQSASGDMKKGRQDRGQLTQKVGVKLEGRGPQDEDATGLQPQGCAMPAAEADSCAPNISSPGGCQNGRCAVDRRAFTEQ